MDEREKVFCGLEAHANTWGACRTEDGKECPYAGFHDSTEKLCSEQLAQDALALLRAKEPRVLSRVLSEEEVRERLGTFVWVEMRSGKTEKLLCLVFGRIYEDTLYPHLVTIREDSGTAWGRRWADYGAGCWEGIRSGWRCWTTRPTEEQRKAAPWEKGTESEIKEESGC